MKIRGQLKSIWPDRTQYKPYAYNLEMQDVFVEVDIPNEYCKQEPRFNDMSKQGYEFDPILSDRQSSDVYEGGVEIVLNMDGFMCLLKTIADGIDKMHIESLRVRNSRDGDSVRRTGTL